MRAHEAEPWWLTTGLDIVGFETDPDELGDEGSDDEDDGSEGEEDDSESEDESSDDDEQEDQESEDDDKDKTKGTDGLKSALRKERMARKKAERELRRLKSTEKPPPKPEKDKKEEESESSPDTAVAQAKATRLGQKLRTSAVDKAILQFGERFKSQDELLALIDRREIDVDQDDEDPSEIEVDLESVEDAVKALAKRSPHLLKTTRAGSKSGSKFGGSKKKSSTASDDALRKQFPALRR
jgi:hypothetical protein